MRIKTAIISLTCSVALLTVGANTSFAETVSTNDSPPTPSYSIAKDSSDNMVVTLTQAKAHFAKDSASPTLLSDSGTVLGVLPTYAEKDGHSFTLLYTPVDETHFKVEYITDRFSWSCYANTVGKDGLGGMAGGAATGAVSGLAFVPVEPMSVSGGALLGGIGGIVNGLVDGAASC